MTPNSSKRSRGTHPLDELETISNPSDLEVKTNRNATLLVFDFIANQTTLSSSPPPGGLDHLRATILEAELLERWRRG